MVRLGSRLKLGAAEHLAFDHRRAGSPANASAVGAADPSVQPREGMHTGLLCRPSPHRVGCAARIWRLHPKGLVQACIEQRYLAGGLV